MATLLWLCQTLSSLGELSNIHMHTYLIILAVQTSKTLGESLFHIRDAFLSGHLKSRTL